MIRYRVIAWYGTRRHEYPFCTFDFAWRTFLALTHSPIGPKWASIERA